MINYKYDYGRNSFFVKEDSNKVKKYYLKVDREYVEVNEEVYKVCKSSYDKIRNTEKNKVARSILSFEDIDHATFFVVNKEINFDIVEHIYLKEITKKIKHEILLLPEKDKKIAICIFIKELSDRETSRLLNIPQTTITYRKKVIRKIIQEKIKNLCSLSQ